MTDLGVAYFEAPQQFQTWAVIDGMTVKVMPPIGKTPTFPPHVFTMADGSDMLQLDYSDDTAPEGLDHYEFSFELVARGEAEWRHVEKLWKRRARFYFVPWDSETEVFVAGVSLTAFVLPRPTALSVLDAGEHPDVTSYPVMADLDGVAQTVITTGTPGAGEVKIVGAAVTTPTLTAGQELTITYTPAYRVAITNSPQTLAGWNELVRQITLREVRA